MRILIVEDERALCDTLAKSLKRKGYETDIALFAPQFSVYTEFGIDPIPYTPFSSMWATSFISGIELMPPRRTAHSAPTAFAKRSLSAALLPDSRQF